MITEDYCNFEVSKLLREKGFDESCLCSYAGDKGVTEEWYDDYRERVIRFDWEKGYLCEPIDGHTFEGDTIAAPTLQRVLKWLRETHHIDICVCREIDRLGECFKGYIAIVYKDDYYKVTIREATKDLTYEEAANKAIEYCLTLI